MILNKVQLITYADSLGGNLAKLRENLAVNFPSLFSTLHILPLFPSSGDRGFAPLTYREANFNLKCEFKKCVKIIRSPYNLQGKIRLI
jgi:sucrose phosphorylase